MSNTSYSNNNDENNAASNRDASDKQGESCNFSIPSEPQAKTALPSLLLLDSGEGDTNDSRPSFRNDQILHLQQKVYGTLESPSAATTRPQNQLLLIRGQEGVGKTHFVQTFLNQQQDGNSGTPEHYCIQTQLDPPPPYSRRSSFGGLDAITHGKGAMVAQALVDLCRQVSESTFDENPNHRLGDVIEQRLQGGDLATLLSICPQLREILNLSSQDDEPFNNNFVPMQTSVRIANNHNELNDFQESPSLEFSGAFHHHPAVAQPSRIQYVLNLFLQAIQVTIRPRRLIWVIEDLQWINDDEVTMDLIWSFIDHHQHHDEDEDIADKSEIIFVVTVQDGYQIRDSEIWDESQAVKSRTMLGKHLQHLNARAVELTEVDLVPFTEEECQKILTILLNIKQEARTKSLAAWVYRQTNGNIKAMLELLHMLQTEGWIRYEIQTQQWEWESVSDLEVEFDAHERGSKGVSSRMNLYHRRICKLLTAADNGKLLKMLKIASCFGYKVPQKALSYLIVPNREAGHDSSCMSPGITEWLHVAESKGFLRCSNGKFEFANAGIQMALYSMIEDHAKFHYHLGRTLWKACPVAALSSPSNNMIYILVSQLLLGKSHIQEDREKKAVANLCLQAGTRAAQQSSFQSAFQFLKHGIEMLLAGRDRQWSTLQNLPTDVKENSDDDNYALLLTLHNFSAEVAYCCGNFEYVFELVDRVRENARSFSDTWQIESTNVFALGSYGKMDYAIESGLQILTKLGVKIPTAPTNRDIANAHKSSVKLLRGKSVESLCRLPPISDAAALAKMQLLNLLFLYTMLARIDLAAFIGWHMIKTTLASGLSGMASVGFALHASLLCGMGNDIASGYRYGNLALKICERFNVQVWSGRVYSLVYGCVHGWSRPLPESFEALLHAQRMSTESGDMEFAMLNFNIYAWNRFEYTRIPRSTQIMEAMRNRMKYYGQVSNLNMTTPLLQFLHHLMGRPYAANLAKILAENDNFEYIALWCHSHQLVASYLFGDYESAVQSGEKCVSLLYGPFCSVDSPLNALFIGLSALAQAATLTHNRTRRFALVSKAKSMLKLVSTWSDHCPINFLGKQYLLEAELAVVQGKKHSMCTQKFTSAIALSREAGLLMQTALASERAGRFYLSLQDLENAIPLLKQAKELYNDWGAKLKVNHLQDELADVLGEEVK